MPAKAKIKTEVELPESIHVANSAAVYKTATRRKALFVIVGIALCAVMFIADLLTGSADMSAADVLCAISPSCDAGARSEVIVNTYRIPTTLMALGVGAALGLAGGVMQTILNNPLASPYTLGISAGAGFGAALTIVTGFSAVAGLGPWLVPINAFVFALLTSAMIYMIGKRQGLSPGTMVLSGIGVSFLFSALQSLVQYAASAEENQNIVFWLFGSLQRAEMETAVGVCVITAVAIPIALSQAWRFTALKLGDEKATGLGINVQQLRLFGFILSSLLTAVAVSMAGTIGFIGLAGPHVARLLIGEDQRFFMPMSTICGAAVLLAASVASKSIVEDYVFPIGIITSLIGVPIFFAVLLSKQRSYFA